MTEILNGRNMRGSRTNAESASLKPPRLGRWLGDHTKEGLGSLLMYREKLNALWFVYRTLSSHSTMDSILKQRAGPFNEGQFMSESSALSEGAKSSGGVAGDVYESPMRCSMG